MFSNRERKAAKKPQYAQVERHSHLKYPHRLNLYVLLTQASMTLSDAFFSSYDVPPLEDITLEEFETCALDRLRILAEIESSFARNRPYEELKKFTLDQCDKYLPLHSSTAKTLDLDGERRKDHVGHFVLRLAFCRS